MRPVMLLLPVFLVWAPAFAQNESSEPPTEIDATELPNTPKLRAVEDAVGIGLTYVNLYVDQKTEPLGPFLGYDDNLRLVVTVYMPGVDEMKAHKPFLGLPVPIDKVDHVDIAYNAGHVGGEEPHYHVSLWAISKAEQVAMQEKKGTTTRGVAAQNVGPPPANSPLKRFKDVAKGIPDFIPGLGTLYVDPSTLPLGPFYGYDRSGKAINNVYMIPIKDFDEHKRFPSFMHPGNVDHVDVYYVQGHPGAPMPHYHIVEWLISKEEQSTLRDTNVAQGPPPQVLVEPPSPPFKRASEFIAGLGTLYMNPSASPVGPWFAYSRASRFAGGRVAEGGKLVSTNYMLPLSSDDQKERFINLPTGSGGKVDHIDMYYNDPHDGMEEPHYHIVLWYVSTQAQSALQ